MKRFFCLIGSVISATVSVAEVTEIYGFNKLSNGKCCFFEATEQDRESILLVKAIEANLIDTPSAENVVNATQERNADTKPGNTVKKDETASRGETFNSRSQKPKEVPYASGPNIKPQASAASTSRSAKAKSVDIQVTQVRVPTPSPNNPPVKEFSSGSNAPVGPATSSLVAEKPKGPKRRQVEEKPPTSLELPEPAVVLPENADDITIVLVSSQTVSEEVSGDATPVTTPIKAPALQGHQRAQIVTDGSFANASPSRSEKKKEAHDKEDEMFDLATEQVQAKFLVKGPTLSQACWNELGYADIISIFPQRAKQRLEAVLALSGIVAPSETDALKDAVLSLRYNIENAQLVHIYCAIFSAQIIYDKNLFKQTLRFDFTESFQGIPTNELIGLCNVILSYVNKQQSVVQFVKSDLIIQYWEKLDCMLWKQFEKNRFKFSKLALRYEMDMMLDDALAAMDGQDAEHTQTVHSRK